MTKHHSFFHGFFQTDNHSKMICDRLTKPECLLGGLLNIWSAIQKTEQLEKLLNDSNLKFLCLSESWLIESSPVTARTVPGYNYFTKDRKSGKGGGLLMCVKDCCKCKQIDLKCATGIECLAIIICLPPQMSINISVYRPPSADIMFYSHFRNMPKELDTRKECIGLGDFNLNWADKTTKNTSSNKSPYKDNNLLKNSDWFHF